MLHTLDEKGKKREKRRVNHRKRRKEVGFFVDLIFPSSSVLFSFPEWLNFYYFFPSWNRKRGLFLILSSSFFCSCRLFFDSEGMILVFIFLWVYLLSDRFRFMESSFDRPESGSNMLIGNLKRVSIMIILGASVLLLHVEFLLNF